MFYDMKIAWSGGPSKATEAIIAGKNQSIFTTIWIYYEDLMLLKYGGGVSAIRTSRVLEY